MARSISLNNLEKQLSKDYIEDIRIAMLRQTRQHQENLFPNSEIPHIGRKTRFYIGKFYEALTYSIFGGEYHRREKFSLFSLEAEPDLTDSKLEIHFESKGTSIRGDCKLFDIQTARYFLLQIGKGIYKTPKINYAIYLHNVVGVVEKTKGDLESVISELAQNTKFMLHLPFSVIFNIWKAKQYTSAYRRSEGPDLDMTRFRPSEMVRFILNPESSISNFGLNPEDFAIKRLKMPRGIKIDHPKFNQPVKITPFPILFVTDKYHEVWLEKFRRENAEKVEEIKAMVEYIQGSAIEPSRMPLFSGDDEIREGQPEEAEGQYEDKVPF